MSNQTEDTILSPSTVQPVLSDCTNTPALQKVTKQRESLQIRQAQMKAVLKPPPKKYVKVAKRPPNTLSGTPKQIAYLALRKEGHKPAHIEKALGLSQGFGNFTEKKLNGSYSLISDYIVRGAFSSLKKLSKGQPVGRMTDVKGSDVLGACKEIYSRAEPSVQKIETKSLNITVSDATAQAMLDALSREGLSQDALSHSAMPQVRDYPVAESSPCASV